MARKTDIQYVHHYYTSGTAAKKVAVKTVHKKKPLPLFEPRMITEPDRKIIVRLDPMSLSAIAVCAVLMVMMVVSLFQFSAAYQRNVELQEYVYTLENDNVRLDHEYRESFDLKEIETQALALGVIPVEQAQTVTIGARVPAREAELNGWQRLERFLGDLFA